MQARFTIGKYGLIEGFPALYFISLGILTLASAILWTAKENHGELLMLQLIILMISLFMANLMVGGAQSLYTWSLGTLGNPEYILRTGHINPSFWQLWQHNWPGNDIFQAVILQFTGKSIQDFARFLPWLPILWQSLLFLPVFIFLKNTTGKANPNYIWAGMWIYYLGSWPGIQNNGPQPFGTFLAFGVLALISNIEVWRQSIAPLGYRMSTLILYLAVATGHFLSSLVVLAVSVATHIFGRFKSISLPMAIGLFILAWAIYGANVYNTVKIPIMFTQLFSLMYAVQSGIGNQVVGNESHAAVSLVRVLFSGIIILISFSGGLLAFKVKQNRYLDILVLGITAANVILAVIIGSGYSHELFNRFFLYLLPALVYFGVKLLYFRITTILLTLLLIISLPLSFISQYGNEAMDYITAGNLDGAEFFNQHAVHGVITGLGPQGSMQNAEDYSKESYAELVTEDNKVDISNSIWYRGNFSNLPHYIVIDTNNRVQMDFYYNRPDLLKNIREELEVTPHYNIIFANPDMILYTSERF